MSASNDRLHQLADELPADLAGEVVRFAEYLLARRAAEVAAGLPTGSALDVGCGEGASALWLAGRGWQLTAFDHSEVALERARAADPDETVAWRRP